MKKLYIAMIGVAILTIALRLYHITFPIADWHSFRQVDTASVARQYAARGIDLLHPTYHDLSNIQSGKDNPHGYRMVEFPLYQAIAVIGMRAVPSVSVDMWLRVVTIAASAGSAVLVAVLGTYAIGMGAGVLAGIAYAVLPYSIYYGRVTLPEPLAVWFALLSLYALTRIEAEGRRRHSWAGWFWVSSVSASLAVLVKPTAAFLLVPVPYMLYKAYGLSRRFFLRAFFFGVISLLPFAAWREWIQQFPEGIPASDWLFNKNNIRFKGAWFYWLFSQRLSSLILGYWGLIPFGLGLMVPVKKQEGWFLRWLLFGSISYLVVFAGGNVQHDYYQILLLPVIALYIGKGLAAMLSGAMFSKPAARILAGVSMIFALAFSWYTIRTYYWINRPEIITAGQAADRILPKDAKVIAPYNGDTTFLYQTRRTGWPLGFDIDQKIAMGATAYVTVSPTDDDWETRDLAKKYTVLVRNDTYAIIDLTKPKDAGK